MHRLLDLQKSLLGCIRIDAGVKIADFAEVLQAIRLGPAEEMPVIDKESI